jgi:hypothetical protein
MNVIPAERLTGAFATADAGIASRSQSAATAARSTMWAQLGILTAFWAYVMLSNVLYARGMSATLDPKGSEHFFASWQARVVQHLLLYPVLIACVWASRRIGWRFAWRTWPTQIALALIFSALGTPVLGLSELLVGEHHHAGPQSVPWRMASMLHDAKSPLWVASTTSFLLAYGFCLALIMGYVLVRASGIPSCDWRHWSARGAARDWRLCACSCRRIRCSIFCTRSAAISSGIPRLRNR